MSSAACGWGWRGSFWLRRRETGCSSGPPGNVRELEHAIHRAVVLARATRAGDEVVLEPQHFQFAVTAPMLPTETAAAAPATEKRQFARGD